jgi:hypothetical protein
MRHVAFAEFYNLINGSYQEACGDRSVLILDGRVSRDHHHEICAAWAKKHSFAGYRLCRGEISNPFYITASVQSFSA